MTKIFYKSAAYYDLLNAQKDYENEATFLSREIEKHKPGAKTSLLDVCCGTGSHIDFLRTKYACEGLDIDPEFIAIAKKKLPDITFHIADMSTFCLSRRYDVITCLFSSIAYAGTKQAMIATIDNMCAHLADDGLLIIEPWYTPTTFKNGHYTAVLEETETEKISRMYFWSQEDSMSICTSQMLVADANGIRHIAEQHELGLFTIEEYQDALTQAGFDVLYDRNGLTDRGLFVARKQ